MGSYQERLIDRFLKTGPLRNLPLANAQYAYREGRSTETALHHLVGRIETQLEAKGYAIGTFLEIEGAFDSNSNRAIKEATTRGAFRFLTQRLRGLQRKPARIVGYIERTIPQLYREQFREHFRMTPTTYNRLEQRLAPILQGDIGVKCHIPVRKQLLATLWLLATPDSYMSVGERFDISKSSLSVSFMRVVQALNDIVEDVVQWPRGDRLATVKQKFQRLSVLPDIIGAVDGTRISIKEPHEDSLSYKTYKKKYAVILQAVCDSELVFLDCFAGYPGSVGDIRVFKNSDLWSEVQRDRQLYFPNEEYIIGDKAYLLH
ncbi:nuclease harbi1 [Lasius niger]|uniref:Nuclease harbi1 n=1 Tax=Lasius niger TaxID=67767 RepID=A0A0J7K6A8_LASNI|nr:nuclease harbi1 [Lasius niger]